MFIAIVISLVVGFGGGGFVGYMYGKKVYDKAEAVINAVKK